MSHRLCLFHATNESIRPIEEAFQAHWADVPRFNVLDDALQQDLVAAGTITPAITERFLDLSRYAQCAGATTILFTCSAFASCIEHVRRNVAIPVVKPNEAIIDEALDRGGRMVLLSTVEASFRSMKPEFECAAAARGVRIEIDARLVPDAWNALRRGDVALHDRLISEAASHERDCDTLVLTQFSMARAAGSIAAVGGRTLLTTPVSAVRRVRWIMSGEQAKL